MSANPPNGNQLAKLKSWIGAITVGVAVSIATSYSTVKLKEGADARRLDDLEKEVATMKADSKDHQERDEKNYVTREVLGLTLKPIIDAQHDQTSTLQEILNNVKRK